MLNYLVLFAFLLGAVWGFYKGFLRQIASIIGLIIGYLVATFFSHKSELF